MFLVGAYLLGRARGEGQIGKIPETIETVPKETGKVPKMTKGLHIARYHYTNFIILDLISVYFPFCDDRTQRSECTLICSARKRHINF